MSIERAEELKREWTDKYVVVAQGVPHLRRFQHLTGTVKTVNMNCRALVQFDAPEDISWYDIDLNHLSVVEEPRKKTKAEQPAAEAKPAAKKAPAKTGGKSPLEMAREQAGGAKAAPKPAGKKLSPLEQARQQDAAKKAAAQSAETSEAPKESPAPAKPEASEADKKLSPLERARRQDAKKNE